MVHSCAGFLVANRLGPLAVGVAALLLVLAWQVIVVHFGYGDNWSGLFHIGDRWPLPPALAGDGARVSPNDPGYDGVFYHLAAHDPWLTRGFWRFADNPSLRWRRILLPGLAWIAALGDDARIHAAYVGINLLFVFLGAWWLARFSASKKGSISFGLGFLAVPSVLVSMDRLTVDTALAALTIGLFVYAADEQVWKQSAILALCPLARETGLCLSAGTALQALRTRRWKQFLWTALSALPFLFWAGFVSRNTTNDATPWLSLPFAGIIRRTLTPVVYPITGRGIALAAGLDYLALLGVWAAIILAAYLALKRKSGLIEYCIYGFAFAAVWLSKADIWTGAYEFGRTLSPLMILLGLISVRERIWWFLLPLVCTLPRIFLQLLVQLRLAILSHG